MKQCVVVIHGIGEQRPMGTIRGFVDRVLGRRADGTRRYWSKPDTMSDLLELRRLQSKGRSSVHFYEYYWAHKVEGTNLWDSILWLLFLVMRRRRDLPESTVAFWMVCRGLLLAVVSLAAVGGLGAVGSWFVGRPVMGITWIAVTVSLAAAQYVLIHIIGDAARYLSPRPKNIELRRSIRADGIKLLRGLISSKKYDRIVIVGHSLGSVIAYDVITHLWQEYNEEVPLLSSAVWGPAILRSFTDQTTIQPTMRNEISTAGESAGDSPEARNEFRGAQRKALMELRSFGNPWCISDLVTLGSPLTHGMLLMAQSRGDFESMKDERVLPTCPPQRDQKGYCYSAPRPIDVADPGRVAGARPRRFTPLFFHHAAPFAVTRWTNLYIPARFGLFGDIVGGPLAPSFGAGIHDLRVTTGRLGGWAKWFLLAHKSYWHQEKPLGGAPDPARPPLAIDALRDVLALASLRSYRVPKPPAASATPPPSQAAAGGEA